MSGPPNVQPRRSSRLFTSASSTAKVQHYYSDTTVLFYITTVILHKTISYPTPQYYSNCIFYCFVVQENSKKLKMKFPTKIPNRKTKCKSAKTSNSNNLNESLDILRMDPSLSFPDTKIPQYQKAAAGNGCGGASRLVTWLSDSCI